MTPAARAQLTGEVYAHDPSTIIYDAGRYYYFTTGDLLDVRSSSNLTSWVDEPAVFGSVPAWINSAVPGYSGNSLWAPDIIDLDGVYHLYYSASIWGTKLSAIGHATSPTLDPDAPNYNWTDQGMVIGSNHGTPYNAIDPALMLDDSTGRLWMTWGSFNNGIYVKELDPTTGDPLDSSPGVNVAAPGPTPEIEGAAMMRHNGYYYMFVNWGGCCSGVNSTYNIRVGRSTGPTGPFLDRDGVNLLNGGGTVFLDDDGRKIGPGHFSFNSVGGQDMFGYHYYDADQLWFGDLTGRPTFGLRDLNWTGDDWPSIAAVSPNWTGAARSDWSDLTNWTNGVEPNGVGHVANFAAQSTGTHTVTLPGGRTVGTVNFRGFNSYTIGNTAGPTLTLNDVSGEQATLNVAEGSHTIAAPITAVDELEVNVTPGNSTLTLSGDLSAPKLSKYGDGELQLGGANTISGNVFVRDGTLTVTGSVTASYYTSVGYILGETGVLSVRGTGSFTADHDLNIGDTGNNNTPATGTLTLSDQAGVTVNTGGGFYVGSGFFSNTRSQGTVEQTGGTLTVNRPNVGSFIIGGRNSDDATGTYNLSGGAVDAHTDVFVGGYGEGTVNQDGGTFNVDAALSIGRYNGSVGRWTITDGSLNQISTLRRLNVGEGGEGSLTIAGTGQVTAAGTVRFADASSGDGTINLDGGTLITSKIDRGAGSATFNFNGGTLQASNSQSTYMRNLTHAYVKAGGAVFDSQSYDITIGQSLTHDPALGSTPDGGLTKLGAGTLTLIASSTYTGDTNIQAGTLALSGAASIAESQHIIVRPGATLDVSGLTSTLVLQSGQSLTNDSDTTVIGDVIAGSGSTVAGKGSFADNLTLQSGSLLVVVITDPADTDPLNIAGNLSAGGTLSVALDTGAPSPLAGDTFDILDFAAASGSFDVIDLPVLTNSLGWDASNLLTTGVLKVIYTVLTGDLDGDGFVGITDLNLVLGNWNSLVPDGHPTDPTGDNFVGIGDLNVVLGNWNTGTPPMSDAAIPEPATVVLLSLGGLAMHRRAKPRRSSRECPDGRPCAYRGPTSRFGNRSRIIYRDL